jgi:hypothetical protein
MPARCLTLLALTDFQAGSRLSRDVSSSRAEGTARPEAAVRQPPDRPPHRWSPVPAQDAVRCRSRLLTPRQCTPIPPTNRQQMIKKA